MRRFEYKTLKCLHAWLLGGEYIGRDELAPVEVLNIIGQDGWHIGAKLGGDNFIMQREILDDKEDD